MEDSNSMETNKWLWQPKKSGPIYFRFDFTTLSGEKKRFVKSLGTRHWPDARKIRDSEFAPIVHDAEKAERQLLFIRELYPKLEEKLMKGVHGAFEDVPKTKGVSVEELARKWVEALSKKGGNYETSKGTASRYESIADKFVAWAGPGKSASEFTQQDILRYRDARLENDMSSKKTVELELGALKRLFGFAMDRHDLKLNPALGITVQRTLSEKNRENRTKKRRPQTHDEADSICSRFPPHRSYDKRDFEDFSMFARYTGMRQSEIAHLVVDDFVFYNGDEHVDVILANPVGKGAKYSSRPKAASKGVLCVYVKDAESRETKTGLEKIIPVSDKLRPVVERRARALKKGPVFPCAWKGKLVSFSRTYLKKIKTVAPDLTMHGFRHYAASEMENNGVGVNVSCAVLGHVPERVHGGYLHISIKAMKEAVDKIY